MKILPARFERDSRGGPHRVEYDRVAAWGLEGKADLQEAFIKLRLGKKAVTHAKQLKNDNLVNWLRSDRSHCLLDDYPCKLPSYREMKAVTQRLQLPSVTQPLVTAETTAPQELQDEKSVSNQNFEGDNFDNEIVLNAVNTLLGAGISESSIIKDVLGCRGSQYQKGKELLTRLKRE